jgi:hypothetical protein
LRRVLARVMNLCDEVQRTNGHGKANAEKCAEMNSDPDTHPRGLGPARQISSQSTRGANPSSTRSDARKRTSSAACRGARIARVCGNGRERAESRWRCSHANKESMGKCKGATRNEIVVSPSFERMRSIARVEWTERDQKQNCVFQRTGQGL